MNYGKLFLISGKNENDREVLEMAVHWYLEANNNSGYVDGAIIMAPNWIRITL